MVRAAAPITLRVILGRVNYHILQSIFQQTLSRGAGIGIMGDGAADDDVVGAGRESFAWCGDSLLVVQGLVR